jgi:hypothetical protein
VVDYLWYRKNVPGAYPDSLGFDVIDEWGRLIPDPDRWPSSEDGKGFTEVAQKVQSVGLKLGIHVMRGLSRQAYDANTPILDTTTVLFLIINEGSFFSLLFIFFFSWISISSLFPSMLRFYSPTNTVIIKIDWSGERCNMSSSF